MAGEKIYKRVTRYELVEVPEKHMICPICGGKGGQSKYDMGWRSFIHDPEMAAVIDCWFCHALGYVPERNATRQA